jgi:mono/diheme cytochrome c family protein
MPGWLRGIVGVLLAATAAGWWFSRPLLPGVEVFPARAADLANGERLFHAGGCASCHAAPGALGSEPPVLSGGLELASPFGVFVAPNISPDPVAGIGHWSDADFVNAMLSGVSPDGRHYYPAFPYTSYARMAVTDVLDLKAYLATLPADPTPSQSHDIGFPFTIRRGLGFWKRLYLDEQPVRRITDGDSILEQGRYLVEGPGHCGECHTSRDAFGGLRLDQWLSGAPSLEGEGRVPDITPDGLSGWSESDIVYYLESGFEPDFDVVGGSMVKVQENMARLPAEDRQAIAAYLKSSGQP